MTGKLLAAKRDMFHALNTDTTGWAVTIETRILKRKVQRRVEVQDGVDLRDRIGQVVKL